MAGLDAIIDRTTTYRLVLYLLLVYLALGALLAQLGKLAFTPGQLLGSAAFLVVICWAANTLFARVSGVPANLESALITALILAVIFDPAKTKVDLSVLGWIAILAMASKYILAIYHKHLFNPAAVAAVIAAFVLNMPASWWIGTAWMLPAVAIGAFLIVRKTRQGAMVFSFLATAVITLALVSLVQSHAVAGELRQVLLASPLIFFASIMLTEPLTAPPTKALKCFYGAFVGFLFVPQMHLGSLYSTPELALVIGNVFSYLVSPQKRYRLTPAARTVLSPDVLDFAFALPSQPDFSPGQYMEWTLEHPGADRRGTRRYFTLASSPTEKVLHLGVKFHQPASSYKRAMWLANEQTTFVLGQVAGDFTLPFDPDRKLAFIAGGIGITPYRSMLKYLLDTGEPRDIVVIYANRCAPDIVYSDVLDAAQRDLGIRTIYTLTDPDSVPPGWSGCTGRVDAEMLAREIPDYQDRLFYLSGPPEMVRDCERQLRSLRVSRRNIKKDLFSGLA